MMFNNFLIVGFGGFIGTVLRYAISLIFKPGYFPYATLLVNIIGSFIIGVIISLSMKEPVITQQWKLFIATGICGGFTTFSAFSAENMLLMQEGKYFLSILYIVASILLALSSVFIGFRIAS